MKTTLIALTLIFGSLAAAPLYAQTTPGGSKSGTLLRQATGLPPSPMITGYPCGVEISRYGKLWISLYTDSYCQGLSKGVAVIEREDWSTALPEPWDYDSFNNITELVMNNRWSLVTLLVRDVGGVNYVSSVTFK